MHRFNRLAALMLAGIIGIGGPVANIPGLSFDSWAGYEKVNGVYQMLDGTAIEGVHARGIDVSQWQGVIDWNAVAADDIQFVMLGTRYSGTVDPYFDANAKNAAAAGLDVGVYIYSYATTVEMAEEEADFVLNLIKDYKISYPVAFDMEANVQSTLPPSELSAMINAFGSKIEAAGYYPILYANDYWLANKLDMSQIDYDVWVARYEKKHVFENPVMWQATSTGRVDGVNGNVDIDFQYVDLSEHLPANLWRTIDGITYYYKDHQKAKDTWIDDGSDRYYIQTDGTAYKGWRKEDDKYYLLDTASAKMVTGWHQEDNKWYYLSPGSGQMGTGWQMINDKWYYMNPSDGVMKTGWHDDSSKRYYLDNSGAMVSGWQSLNGSWYYFRPDSGTMFTGWLNDNGAWYYMEPGSGSDSGKMKTGWLDDGGKRYFLSESSGRMTTGWRLWNNSWYYFGNDGAMMTGMIDVNGVNYYIDPSTGTMVSNITVNINGTDYNAAADGSLSAVQAVENEGDNGDASQAPPSGDGSVSAGETPGDSGNGNNGAGNTSTEEHRPKGPGEP